MRLPDLELQDLYLDAGWSLVVAAAVVGIARRAFLYRHTPLARLPLLAIAVATAASMWLPAPWTPSFWLGMAFQHPSVLLVVLAAIFLVRVLLEPRPLPWLQLLPPLPAATLAVLGAFLYAGAFAWIPLDLYAVGYGGYAAATMASALVVAWYMLDRRSALTCAAMALAALVHAVTRLPSGNAWDALIDPMLFAWAAGASLVASWTALRGAYKVRDRAVGEAGRVS